MQEVDKQRVGVGLQTDFSRSWRMDSSSAEKESICEGRIGGCRIGDGSRLFDSLNVVGVADGAGVFIKRSSLTWGRSRSDCLDMDSWVGVAKSSSSVL